MTDPNVWWRGLPSIEATIECLGAEHVLRFESGELRLDDHTDIEAEGTLTALAGADAPRCVDVYHAWRAAFRVEDGRLIGDPTIPTNWLRTVYVRGICADCLVLDVLESPPTIGVSW